MNRKKTGLAAAIDVGSNTIRMVIAQITPKGETVVLEDLRKPTGVGKDTFSFGRVQVDTIHETCEVLKGFSKLLEDYRVKDYRAVCTSGIREAENREYVLEQIRLRTGLRLEIINNAQERFLMYKAIRDYFPDQQWINDRGTLIVDIRSGGVEISVYSEGSLKFTEYVKIGSLRLREILADLEQMTLDFPSIMEEFIESRIDFLKPRIKEVNITNFIGLGGELRTITGLCGGSGGKDRILERKELAKLYSRIHSLSTGQIILEYGLDRNQAEILLPSIILLYGFLDMTEAEGIYTPLVSLRHGLLADMADEALDTPGKQASLNSVISSVWYIGEKYSIDKTHCANVERLALDIFDQTGRIHRLGERERFYLRVSAILHDIGKYVNLNQHDIHSYNIIKFQDIMGFSNRELNIVANISRYHSEEIPHQSDEGYLVLREADQIVVSKLAAILKLAEALDVSHKQKVAHIDINASGRELVLNVKTDEDLLLETWSFSSHITFFEEVMGLRPVLKKRGM